MKPARNLTPAQEHERHVQMAYDVLGLGARFSYDMAGTAMVMHGEYAGLVIGVDQVFEAYDRMLREANVIEEA